MSDIDIVIGGFAVFFTTLWQLFTLALAYAMVKAGNYSPITYGALPGVLAVIAWVIFGIRVL